MCGNWSVLWKYSTVRGADWPEDWVKSRKLGDSEATISRKRRGESRQTAPPRRGRNRSRQNGIFATRFIHSSGRLSTQMSANRNSARRESADYRRDGRWISGLSASD